MPAAPALINVGVVGLGFGSTLTLPDLARDARFRLVAGADPRAPARAAFERALAQADARRVPAELVEVAQAYLPWLVAQGDGARASVLAGRVGGWAEADHAAALLQLRFQHALGNADGWRNALVRARDNAGERRIPDGLEQPPAPRG